MPEAHLCVSASHLLNKYSRLATSRKPLGKEKYVGSQGVRGPSPPTSLHPYKEAKGISQVMSLILKKGWFMVVALITNPLSHPTFPSVTASPGTSNEQWPSHAKQNEDLILSWDNNK